MRTHRGSLRRAAVLAAALAVAAVPNAWGAAHCADAAGCREWSVEYRPRDATAHAGALDASRNVAVVAGAAAGPAVAGFDATTGRRLWVAVNTFGGGWYSASAASGTVVVTGADSTNSAAITAAYDTRTGRRTWFVRQSPSGALQDSGVVALQSARRGLAISAGMVGVPTAAGAEQRYTWRVSAYDLRTGHTRWQWTRRAPFRQDTVTDAALTPDGGTLVVTGYSLGAVNEDWYVTAFDTSSGRVRWTNRRDDGNDEARAVAMSPDGRTAYVAGVNQHLNGSFATAGTVAATVVAFDVTTGRPRWSWRSQPPLVDVFPNAVAASANGLCLAGTSALHDATGTTAYAACLDGRGRTTWEHVTTPTAVSGEAASSVAIDPAGDVYVGGSALGPGGTTADAVTASYDLATGATRWRATLPGGASYDRTSTIAVLPRPHGVLAVAHLVDDMTLTPTADPNTARAWALSRYQA